jgi:hypothetical protein
VHVRPGTLSSTQAEAPPGADYGASVTLDLTAADLGSYRGLMGGDGVTVVAMVRRPTRRDDDAIPLLAEIIEPDRR